VRRYFGETDVQPCGQCDLCIAPPQMEDATKDAQKALSAVQRLGGRFGRGRIVDHLLAKTKDVAEWETALSTWGIGAGRSAPAWRDLIDQLLFDGLLREDANDGRPLIGLGDSDAVRAVYRGERTVSVRQHAAAPAKTAARSKAGIEVASRDRVLFDALRAWRKTQAAAQAVPPYVIFADRTLAEVAATRPDSMRALGAVNGVGAVKLEHYGRDVLSVVEASLIEAAE
jgi:ATP-dependent DNA helicase RecQ